MTASTQHVKEKYWRDHIRQAEQSGETFKRYAERHELNLKSLYDWRSRLKKKDAPTRSVAEKAAIFARVISVPPPPRAGIELRVGGVTLSTDALPDPAWLARLVQALELR